MFIVISDTGAISTGTPTLARAQEFAKKYRDKRDGDGRYVAILAKEGKAVSVIASWEHDGKGWQDITPGLSNAAT